MGMLGAPATYDVPVGFVTVRQDGDLFAGG
jgi:hypothetical protein